MECSTVIQTADQVVFPADVIIKRSIAQPDQQEFRLCLKVKKSGLETFLIPIVGLIGLMQNLEGQKENQFVQNWMLFSLWQKIHESTALQYKYHFNLTLFDKILYLYFRYFWHLVDHFFCQLKREVKSSLVNPNSSNLLLVCRQNDLKICKSPTWFLDFLIALIFRPLQAWIRWRWTRTLQLLQHRLESIVTKEQQVLNLKNFIMKMNFPKEVTMVMASMLMDQNLVRSTLFILILHNGAKIQYLSKHWTLMKHWISAQKQSFNIK